MKYKTENQMILDLMPALLGALIPRQIKCFAEVPRYSGNDHTDIMLVDVRNKSVLGIEFKLNGPKALSQQVEYNRNRFRCIGIINTELRENEWTKDVIEGGTCVYGDNAEFNTRQEALTEAIKQANNIINERNSNA